jgi:hypothetical protein
LKCDIAQAAHLGEAAQQTLVEGLGDAIDGPVVVRVMLLVGGKAFRQAQHRSRGSGHHLLHAGARRRFHHVERAFGEYVESQARILGTLRYADRRLVKDDVARPAQVLDERAVTDVSLDDLDREGRHGLVEV